MATVLRRPGCAAPRKDKVKRIAIVLAASIPAGFAEAEISADQLNELSYTGIYDEPVALTAGRYEGPPFASGGASRPTVTLIDWMVARGDLNADGNEDAAVYLVEDSGGSGSFVYLAVVLSAHGEAVNSASILVGDRPRIRSLRIANGVVETELIAAGAAEPLALPAHRQRKRYRLQDGRLVEVSDDALGGLAIADLESDTWVLIAVDRKRSPLSGPTVTARFAEGRVFGSAGCNEYQAVVADAGPGRLSVGAVSSTRMVCAPAIMQQEDEFLRRLQNSDRYDFDFGRLRLTHSDGSLLFAPR